MVERENRWGVGRIENGGSGEKGEDGERKAERTIRDGPRAKCFIPKLKVMLIPDLPLSLRIPCDRDVSLLFFALNSAKLSGSNTLHFDRVANSLWKCLA